jgi:hypothetical protein
MNTNIDAQFTKDLDAYIAMINATDDTINDMIEAYNLTNPRTPLTNRIQPYWDGRLVQDDYAIARIAPDYASILPIDPPVPVTIIESQYMERIADGHTKIREAENAGVVDPNAGIVLPVVNNTNVMPNNVIPPNNTNVMPNNVVPVNLPPADINAGFIPPNVAVSVPNKPRVDHAVDVPLQPRVAQAQPAVRVTDHVNAQIVQTKPAKPLSFYQQAEKRRAELALANKNKPKYSAYQVKNKTVTNYATGSTHIVNNYIINTPNGMYVPQGNANMTPIGMPMFAPQMQQPAPKTTSVIEEILEHDTDMTTDLKSREIVDPRAYMRIPNDVKVYGPQPLARLLKKPQDNYFLAHPIEYFDYYRNKAGVTLYAKSDYRQDYK